MGSQLLPPSDRESWFPGAFSVRPGVVGAGGPPPPPHPLQKSRLLPAPRSDPKAPLPSSLLLQEPRSPDPALRCRSQAPQTPPPSDPEVRTPVPSSFRPESSGVQAHPSQALRSADSPAPPLPGSLSLGVGTPETALGVADCPSQTLPSCLSFLRQAPPLPAPPPSLPTRGPDDPDAGIPGEEAWRRLPGAPSSAPPAVSGAAAAPPPARWL